MTKTVAPVVAPIINLNGTSAHQLIAAIETAITALTNADAALCECAPHGRDYPIEANYPVARAQHAARREALEAVVKELTVVYENLQEQQDARGR